MRWSTAVTALIAATTMSWIATKASTIVAPPTQPAGDVLPPEEMHDQPAPAGQIAATTSPSTIVERNGYRSIQVNVTATGLNIVGDAANEPSIAVDPTDASRIVIGWRQFDTVTNDFRQAGRAYSHNAGATWTFPGVLDPGQFRSDPVLGADADGNFYYYSLSTTTSVELFKSTDGGVTWGAPVNGFGGDKQWMTIDRTSGAGRGNIYVNWNVQFSCCGNADFARSIDGGASFQFPLATPFPSMKWGTLDVGPGGELYLAGTTLNAGTHVIAKSSNAQNRVAAVQFDFVSTVSLGGITRAGRPPNPGGLLGQVWVATNHSGGAGHGDIYILGSVDISNGIDPLDVHLIRSSDGGLTWSDPVRVNDDSTGNGAWQWFGTMSVAPNGRIDVVWNDTRNTGQANFSELFYANSLDGGRTWSPNIPVSPVFNSTIGWPVQQKMGDYYHMVSDNAGANLAYAATFNGEQDVYFLRIGDFDCNDNGVVDSTDITNGTSLDCNGNDVPDECERDCNDTGQPDDCDVTDGTSPDCDASTIPDECEPDFDGDSLIDACDPDIDNDGITNLNDQCDFSRLGFPVDNHGRPLGDNNDNCVLDLDDYLRWYACFTVFGPDIFVVGACDVLDRDFDFDVDLRDAADFFNAFGEP